MKEKKMGIQKRTEVKRMCSIHHLEQKVPSH